MYGEVPNRFLSIFFVNTSEFILLIERTGNYMNFNELNLRSEILRAISEMGYEQATDIQVNILVWEYRCSGGTDTANPAAGNRCSGTGIPHLIDCYLRVYSLKAGSNPYTSRMDL